MEFKNIFNRVNKKPNTPEETAKKNPNEGETKESGLRKLINRVRENPPWGKNTVQTVEHTTEGGGEKIEENMEEEVDTDTPEVSEASTNEIPNEEPAPTEEYIQEQEDIDDETEGDNDTFTEKENNNEQQEVQMDAGEKEAYEKLVFLCEQAVEKLREKGIDCLDSTGRIDMEKFAPVRDEKIFKEDQKRVQRLRRRYNDGPLTFQKNRIKRDAEYLEMITFIVFAKCALEKGLAVVRSSHFDDYIRKTDTIMMNINTGAIIANNDEVLPNRELLYEREKIANTSLKDRFEITPEGKRNKVSEINKECGVTLEYALKRDKEGNIYPSDTPIRNVPIVHLTLSERNMLSLIKKMKPTIDEISKIEWQMYRHFLNKTQTGISKTLLDTYDNEKEEVERCSGRTRCKEAVKRKFTRFRKKLERSESFLHSIRAQDQEPIAA